MAHLHISRVKTARRVGEFYLNDDQKLSFKYDPNFPIEDRRSPNPRVYLFTVDGIIYKIGGSEDKGGIKSTLGFYLGGRSGSPGPSRFITYSLIVQELRKGKRVEVYIITSSGVTMQVCGLFDCKEKQVYPFREMESTCLEDYKREVGEPPLWNFKERNKGYPQDLYREYLAYQQRRANRRSRVNRRNR